MARCALKATGRSAATQGAAGGGAETVAATDSAQGRSAASSKVMVTIHRLSSLAILACRIWQPCSASQRQVYFPTR